MHRLQRDVLLLSIQQMESQLATIKQIVTLHVGDESAGSVSRGGGGASAPSRAAPSAVSQGMPSMETTPEEDAALEAAMKGIPEESADQTLAALFKEALNVNRSNS